MLSNKFLIVVLAASLTMCSFGVSAESHGGMVPYKVQYTRVTDFGSIPVPQGQLKDQLEILKRKAVGGDGAAAAELYAALGGCGTLRAANRARFDEVCRGITQADVDEMGRWLILAAQLGNPAAQYSYAAGGMGQLYSDPLYGLKHPEVVKAYRAQARAYLEGFASQCHFNSIAAIARDAANDGLLYGDDPDVGYKFQVVLNTISTTPNLAREAALEVGIDPKKLFSLRGEAASFVDQHCK